LWVGSSTEKRGETTLPPGRAGNLNLALVIHA
jgi:hypothetical protein